MKCAVLFLLACLLVAVNSQYGVQSQQQAPYGPANPPPGPTVILQAPNDDDIDDALDAILRSRIKALGQKARIRARLEERTRSEQNACRRDKEKGDSDFDVLDVDIDNPPARQRRQREKQNTNSRASKSSRGNRTESSVRNRSNKKPESEDEDEERPRRQL